MFKLLTDNKYSKSLADDAMPYIQIERLKYKAIFDYIIEFCSKEKLIISNIQLLTNTHEYWENINIYSIDSETVAKNLIQKLCNKFDKKFVLKITEWENSYSIEYDLRRLCNISLFKIHEKYDITDFINPIKHIVNDKYEIYLLSPLLEVILLYADLYNPTFASTWEELLIITKQLEIFVDKEFDNILVNGLPNKNINKTGGESAIKLVTKQVIKPVEKNITNYVLDFISDTNYLLINDIAYAIDKMEEVSKFINSSTISSSKIIEIISKNSIEFDFKALTNYINKFIPNGINYKEELLFLPKEIRMSKHIFYIVYNNGIKSIKEPFLIIYNNLSYELINYIDTTIDNLGTFKTADPITQLRFIYISIYEHILQYKISGGSHVTKNKQSKSINKNDLNSIFTEKIQMLKFYKNKINIYEKKLNYIGIYSDLNITKKNMNILNPNVNKATYYCFDF